MTASKVYFSIITLNFMKTVILCGGRGSRMQSETESRPKPLLAIGGKPILWHIMKIYAHHGFNEFILALGYKGELIKEYVTGGLQDGFKIEAVDTGSETLTSERIKKLEPYIDGSEFMLTYGDGVADIDIPKLIEFHRGQGTIGTITGANPYSKYGFLNIDFDKNLVVDFHEKPLMRDNYVNSGFMVFNKKIFDYLDSEMLEKNTLPILAKSGELSVYRHHGFWKAMDTPKEVEELNNLWQKSQPWKIWS